MQYEIEMEMMNLKHHLEMLRKSVDKLTELIQQIV